MNTSQPETLNSQPKTLATWQYMLQLIRFRPWLYLALGILAAALERPGAKYSVILEILSRNTSIGNLRLFSDIGSLQSILHCFKKPGIPCRVLFLWFFLVIG